MKHSYHGGCLCGAVQFEVELDLAAPKPHARTVWEHEVGMTDFRLLAGDERLSGYQFGARPVHAFFCDVCGAHAFSRKVWSIFGVTYVVDVRTLDAPRRDDARFEVSRCACASSGAV